MAQRRHHYEQAFEAYLRSRRIPYVAVDEARKTLLPEGATLAAGADSLKSFDFVVYLDDISLLLEVKGRRVAPVRPGRRASLQNWVTEEDIESLGVWESLFGDGFAAAMLFVYWCDEQPPDVLFQETFQHRDRWYALRIARRRDYVASMRPRSERWRTVHVPTREFERISHPFHAPGPFTEPDPDAASMALHRPRGLISSPS